MKALLIVGMQVDLLPGGPAEVPDSQALVGIVNQLMPGYERVVAANFSLPADHVSFAANHLWRRPGQTVLFLGHEIQLHYMFCVQGSFGEEFIPGLNAHQIAFTAKMGTDSQTPPRSAFFDFEKKRDTGLAAFLASQNIGALDIVGIPWEAEVRHSLEDAIALGIEAKILTEACRGNAEPSKA
jgi:nicotinamidase/pyrazinamidase